MTLIVQKLDGQQKELTIQSKVRERNFILDAERKIV